MNKPMSLHDAPPKIQNHILYRISQITDEYYVQIEDLCRLYNVDYNETIFEIALNFLAITKAKVTMSIARELNLPPETVIQATLESAGIDTEEFLKWYSERGEHGS